jgi:hypothetical protein
VTNLHISGPTGLYRQLLRLGNWLLAQSAEIGALPELYAAVDPDAQSGKFYGPHRMKEARGYPTEVQPIESARDEATARRLWTVSEELTGVTWVL